MTEFTDNLINQLKHHMAENGLPCGSDIIADGKYKRYCYKGTRKKDEWYKAILLDSGALYCEYGTWPFAKYTFTSSPDGKVVDLAEIEAVQRQWAQEQEQQYKQTAEDAKRRWSQASICTEHPYLTKKQVKSYGLRVDGQDLLIPLYDGNFQVVSLQKIYEDESGFHKKFMWGGKTWGCFFIIGDIRDAFSAYIVEGYATGASVHEATGRPVIVAFSKGQVINVAYVINDLYPKATLYLCGELDKAGQDLAKDWEKNFKTEVFMPQLSQELQDSGKKDFNDVHVDQGLTECARQLALKYYTGMNLLDFLSSEIPPIEWQMPGLIMKNSFTLIYGAPGVGKSRVTYCLAWCLANGSQFKFIKWSPSSSCRVLYCDSEMLDIEVQDYWAWVIEGYPAATKPMLNIITKNYMEKNFGEVPNLYNIDHRIRFDRLFEEHDIIFLDNFDGLSCAPEDDVDFGNKSSSFQPISRWLQSWLNRGKTIVLVDHANKSGDLQGTGAKKRAPQTILSLLPVPADLADPMKLNILFQITKGRHVMPIDKLPFVATWDPPGDLNPQGKGDPWVITPVEMKKLKK